MVTGLVLMAGVCLSARAQFGGGGGGFRSRMRFGEQATSPEQQREQKEMDDALTPGFKDDVFTFARLHFRTDIGMGFRSWDDDSPEADLNIIYRLFQVTSLTVRPGFHDIDITPDDLAKNPFVYAAAGGRMHFTDEEANTMRQYLENGGFLMVDDFWGDSQREHCFDELKRVFPNRGPLELGLDSRIFHAVFDFKYEPQIPSVRYGEAGYNYDPGYDYGYDGHGPHYYGIFDAKGRMMVLICHNNHYGDGWEHESEDQTYFDRFSEPMGYPMMINILYYTSTH
jgi:hypothetical protein